MRWYLNDSSLQGQFSTAREFVDEIAKLAKLRMKAPGAAAQLYCVQSLALKQVTRESSCKQAVMKSAMADERKLILAWIDKGPFIEEDRLSEEDDYFEFEGLDVTNHGLGEAARREKNKDTSGVFSFSGGAVDFDNTPLVVQHGIPEYVIGHVEVCNVWEISRLDAKLREISEDPKSWEQLVETCQSRFSSLLIPDSILSLLSRETFYPNVARRTLTLLGVLQEIMNGRSAQGKLNSSARLLWKEHSHGDNAWFSDESKINKRMFRNEMTFPDPENPQGNFCPWHGKIKNQQFRIHFEWPVPQGQSRLKVLYIGPKITKK